MIKDIEAHRAKWAGIARANGWHSTPFYVQIWVNESGEITDSVSFAGLACDLILPTEYECLECGECNAPEFYRDGVCGECQTVEDTATPLTDTNISVLELCRVLVEIRGVFECRPFRLNEWVSALDSACELLKAHAGDSDLSGME